MMLVRGMQELTNSLGAKGRGPGDQEASIICKVVFFREDGRGAITANCLKSLIGSGWWEYGIRNIKRYIS